MTAPQRNHDNCGPACIWCALQSALKARRGAQIVPLAGGTAQGGLTTGEQLLTDIDQVCNFLGDLIASEPNESGCADLCKLAGMFIANRIRESRARNMTHPVWRAQHERANGQGGTA